MKIRKNKCEKQNKYVKFVQKILDKISKQLKVQKREDDKNIFAKGSGDRCRDELNLTEEGVIDWIQFNSKEINNAERKMVEKTSINNISILENNNTALAIDTKTNYIYTDGKNQRESSKANNTGIIIYGKENGVKFTIPYIDDLERKLNVYVGSWESKVILEVYINDEVIPAVWDLLDYRNNTPIEIGEAKHKVFTIDYRLVDKNEKLDIKIYIEEMYNEEYGNLTIQAITLR